jgi:CHAD domain-containing protein
MLHELEKGDVRALHRTRVASRRLRELLPVLELDAAVARKLGRRLRRVTDGLGLVRELDVLSLLLDELHESGRHGSSGLSRVATSVVRERNGARKRLRSKLPVDELRRVAEKLDDVAQELQKDAASGSGGRRELAWRWAIEARVTNRAERLSAAMRDAGAVYLAERLHAVRIALKKLRYAVELRVEAAGERANAQLKTLKQVQEVLGHLHDRQVLIDRIRQIQAGATADARTERELEAIVDGLEDECRRLHARYVRDRASIAAVCARVGSAAQAGSARRLAARRVAS